MLFLSPSWLFVMLFLSPPGYFLCYSYLHPGYLLCYYYLLLFMKFSKNGFLVVEDFLREDEIEAMKAECAHLVEKFDLKEHLTIFSTRDDQPVICIGLLPVSVSLSLSVSLSVCLPLYFSLCVSLSLSFYLSFALIVFLYLRLSLSACLPLSRLSDVFLMHKSALQILHLLFIKFVSNGLYGLLHTYLVTHGMYGLLVTYLVTHGLYGLLLTYLEIGRASCRERVCQYV